LAKQIANNLLQMALHQFPQKLTVKKCSTYYILVLGSKLIRVISNIMIKVAIGSLHKTELKQRHVQIPFRWL
jgi:hypothetical protein